MNNPELDLFQYLWIKRIHQMSSFTTILQCISILAALVGGFSALFQYIRQNKRKRADKLYDIVRSMRSDQDIREVIHSIEKDTFRYDGSFYLSEIENKTDKTLEHLSYFCYLKSNRLIGDKEFSFLEYEIMTVISNQEIQTYLYNLYHFARRNVFSFESSTAIDSHIMDQQGDKEHRLSSPTIPFEYLLQYADKKGLLKKGFFHYPGPYPYTIEN